MDGFDKKTLKTSRGYTYTYYTSAGDSSLPTLFFQHGFPDHATMWQQVASGLRPTNHPMIIPDMLGYDGTDKPTDPAEYKFEFMTKDMVEILDAEGAQKCISIGHDWGSSAASRLYQYHPERVTGLVNINVPYVPATGQPYSLDATNAIFEKVFGYPAHMYWNLFTAPDGAAVLESDLELLHDMFHAEGEMMKEFFCAKDNLRNELLHKTKHEFTVRPYAKDPAFKKAFVDRMRRDGFTAPLCWYKATVENLNTENDAKLPEGRNIVNVPALYFGGTGDFLCRPEMMYQSIQNGLLPTLEQAGMIEAGHWTPYEAPDEVVAKIEPWLKKHYAK